MKSAAPLLALLLALAPAAHALSDSKFQKVQDRIEALQKAGDFKGADAAVADGLNQKLTPAQKRALEFETERTRRIRKDYSLTEEGLRAALKKSVRDVTDAEIDAWIKEGRFDRLVIDGEARFVGASSANLFFRNADVRPRRLKEKTGKLNQFLLAHTRAVRSETKPWGDVLGAPRDFKLTMTIAADKDAAPAGETIQCWMPYPQQGEFQSGIKLLASTPAEVTVGWPSYPIRSLYFHQPAVAGQPTAFKAEYTLTVQPRRYQIDPSLVGVTDQRRGAPAAYFTQEQLPHVPFTPEVKALAAKIVGNEKNPAVKARLIYDYLAKTNKYSFAREYSTLRCIPEYVLENHYGDCGQIALTYITLCRAAGVPARWQSGWVIYPQLTNLHDWTEIWLAPYGWVPVDPDYAMEWEQDAEGLSADEVKELQDFFFGGLDAYRIAMNREHGYPLYPPKKDYRSDDVDQQRGELETASGNNIYFSDFNYNMDVEFLSEEGRTAAETDKKPAAPVGPTAPGVAR